MPGVCVLDGPLRQTATVPIHLCTAGQECIAHALPTDKLSCKAAARPPRTPVVLVACGSFNPPTALHMRMFDLAAHELTKVGVTGWATARAL